jgi:hypothetical protein
MFKQEGCDLIVAVSAIYNELGHGVGFGRKVEFERKRFVVDDLHVRTKQSRREH